MCADIVCRFNNSFVFLIPERLELEGRIFELEENAIGRGGNGVVFKCSDASSGEEFAIKVVNTCHNWVRARFERECEHMLMCNEHRHIIKVILYGYENLNVKRLISRNRNRNRNQENATLSWCLMELAEDGNLGEYIKSNPLPRFNVYSAHIRGLASALGFMHENNILHRDIKPENILISGERWLLGDFGLTAPIERSGQDLTRENDKIGPRYWMSPEATNKALGCPNGSSDISTQSDVFQMASVFWYVINNTHPMGIVEKTDYDGKDELFEVLYSSLKHNPSSRPVDGKELFDKLSEAIEA